MQKIMFTFVIILFMTTTQVWAAKDEDAGNKTTAYISLGKPMVLNLSSSKGRLTFLQVQADILIRDSDSEEIVKIHIPAIRHQLIILLSEQPASTMKSPTKREKIRSIATVQVQELMVELANNNDVIDVLFSNLLVQ